MAISPPSDIVLDVARAVEPAELQAARARLVSAAGDRSAGDTSAGFSVSGIREKLGGQKSAGSPTPEAFVRFEAMVLQNFVEKMLPSDAQNVYGSGVAGEMWKSFLAQELGTQIAKAGGIGISERILGDYYMAGDDKVPISGVEADTKGKQAGEAQSLLSTALIQEIQRTIVNGVTEAASAAGGVTAGE